MAETACNPAERDLCSVLLDMEEDIKAVCDCLEAIRLMTVNPIGDFGPVHIGAVYRVADVGRGLANAVNEQWGCALELAKDQREAEAA